MCCKAFHGVWAFRVLGFSVRDVLVGFSELYGFVGF